MAPLFCLYGVFVYTRRSTRGAPLTPASNRPVGKENIFSIPVQFDGLKCYHLLLLN